VLDIVERRFPAGIDAARAETAARRFPWDNLFNQTRLIGCAHDVEVCEVDVATLIILRPSGLLASALAIHVGGNGRDDDPALADVLIVHHPRRGM
jgi:hypothetical protein